MKKDNKKLGIFHILLAALCFSLMTFFIRLAGDIPTMQKAFFRNAVAALFALGMLIRDKEPIHLPRNTWFPLFARCLMGTLGIIGNFYAIDCLGIADANMLNKMSPFFAIIMSVFILKEIPNKVEVSCVIAAFVGVLFIVKPTGGFTAAIPALVGLFGGFAAGTAYTFVRLLGKRNVKGAVIIFAFSLFSCIFLLPFLAMGWKHMTVYQTIMLLMTGLAAAFGQINITAAYQYASAKEISVFDYTQVFFAAVLGILFFSEVPDAASVVGYIIIIGVAVFKWRYNLICDRNVSQN